jgi:peptide deformylase
MSQLDIINIPDPILRQTSEPVERFDDHLQRFIDDMFETMYEAPGIGLAAVQVALPRRLIVCDVGNPEDDARHEAALEAWEQQVLEAQDAGFKPPERPKRPKGEKNPIVLINPEIVSFSDDRSVYEEGCLSIPDYFADVERPAGCTVEFFDRVGKKQTLEATGLLATCVQHEIDHLNGKLFIDYISKLKREMVIRKFTKIARQSGKASTTARVI